MKKKKKTRVLIAPVEVAGYYRNLCAGFQELDIHCDFVTYADHPFGYAGETHKPKLLQVARWFDRMRGDSSQPFIVKAVRALPVEILRTMWALLTLFRYDVFIFGLGNSLIRFNLDLPLLKALGKTVICNIGHGSEARPSYICGSRQSDYGAKKLPLKTLAKLTKKRSSLVKRTEKYASIVIGAPFSTSQFASQKMINWFALGIPSANVADGEFPRKDLSEVAGVPKRRSVKILHAPSRPVLKGTSKICAAIENLRKKGYDIEFTLIQGRPFREVIWAIEECDFVVDQLYSDTPLASFATEAAWYGKPTVVGGYGLDQLNRHISEEMLPPSMACHPDHIEEAIERMILDQDGRMVIGAAVQKFVREKWQAISVARRYVKLIKGDIPSEWWLIPEKVSYLHGVGQTENLTRENIRALIKEYGVEGLCLQHRPELQEAFVAFAGHQESDYV